MNIISENFYKGVEARDSYGDDFYAEIFKNPDQGEVNAIKKAHDIEEGVRIIADLDGNLYAWNTAVVHTEILEALDLDNVDLGLHAEQYSFSGQWHIFYDINPWNGSRIKSKAKKIFIKHLKEAFGNYVFADKEAQVILRESRHIQYLKKLLNESPGREEDKLIGKNVVWIRDDPINGVAKGSRGVIIDVDYDEDEEKPDPIIRFKIKDTEGFTYWYSKYRYSNYVKIVR